MALGVGWGAAPPPASQPAAAPPSSQPATSPATREAQERLAAFEKMKQVARENGFEQPSTQAASQPARQAGEPTTRAARPEDERARRLAEARARLEEARRKALEARDRRQAQARAARAAGEVTTQEATESASPPAAAPAPPREPERVEPPPSPDGRDYFISFKNMPWEDVIRHYARLVGKPLIGELYVTGELTYESPRRFTKEEMRDELNFLLLEQDYFIVEKEDYIYVVPSSELSKELELDRVFSSIEAFEAANLRDLELCSVLIQIRDRRAEEVRDMLSPSMPDRALPVVVGETNKIKITGLAQDVRRFRQLLKLVEAEEFDPRQTRFIKVETNVRQIEEMVRDYLEIKRPVRRYNRQTRQFETVGGESDVLIIPDERTKNLIVKATPAKLDEIEDFIRKIDEKPDIGEFKTTVISVKHGNATDIARLLNEILQQEQGRRARVSYRPPTRTTRGRTVRRTPQAQPTPEDIIIEDIYERVRKTVRIVADDRSNNLIVYANEDGLKRVQEILAQIDQPVPSNFRTFKLQHADAEQVRPTIEQVARGMASVTRGRPPTVVADPNLNALHVLAEREQMNQIEQIIRELDVERDEDEWHFVELKNITASNAARIVTPLLQSTGTVSPMRRPTRGRRGPVRAAATAQVIPLDEASTLVVICSAEEWEKVEQVLKIADEKALSIRPELRFFEIKHGDVESIAETLARLYRNYQHPVLGRVPVLVAAEGKQLIVQAIQPALEEIAALLPALDVVREDEPLVIIPLENADATQVAEIAQGLLPAQARRFGQRGGPGSSLQAEPVTNSLIVKADALTLERIKAFAAEMDAKVAAQKPERHYYTLKNADPRDVVGAINSLFGGTRGVRGRRGPVGEQVKTVVVGSQVVVDAPASKQAEIAALVEKLDSLADQGITTLLVKMPGADVRGIANRLTAAFRERTRRQGLVARFEADTATESILMTCSRDLLPEAEDLLSQYKELTSEHIWQTEFYQLKHANAAETARWLREQLVSLMSRQMSSAVVRQIKVTADMRTNKVIINAPQLAVKQGLLLLEQYDQPVQEQPQPPMEIWTVKLPGLDVRNLATQLQRQLNELVRQRTDRLRASVSADQLTSNLIITAPTDMKKQIDELIAKFSEETADLTPMQKFVQIKEADASYVASQLRNILNMRITRLRGSGVARQVSVQVDTRLNRVILNAPQFAVEMAEALIAELDQPPTTESQLQTIALANADANTINGILRTIFSEKIRARTLSISVEPLTNSLIVGGSKEDFEDIKQWAEELDAKAVEAVGEPVIIELKNANPWEVYNVLNTTFVRRGYGRRQPPGKEVKISIVAGRSLVVQAPPEKLKEIQELAAKLDEIGKDEMVVRTYELKGLGAQLNQFARQIERAVNEGRDRREPQIRITPLPAADTLIVTATEKKLPEVERAMEQFRHLYQPHKIETVALLNADANMVYQALRNVMQPKIRAGKLQISVERMTNSLIISADEEDMGEIREWVAKFDAAAADAVVAPRIFELKNANPWEVRNVLNATFLQSGLSRRRGGMEIRFDVVGGRSIVAKAPADKMKQIEELIQRLDDMVSNKAEVRTFKVPGMGPKLTEFARQIERSVNSQVQARERRISVAAYPAADVLIVTAQNDQFELIEQAMEQFKDIYEPGRIETIALKHGDANAVYQALSRVLQPKIRAGKIQISVEGLTNSLIVMAGEQDLADIRKWAETFDRAAAEALSPPRIFELKNANPWEVRSVLYNTFVSGGRGRRQAGKEVRFDVIGGRSVVAMAPAEKMKEIERLVTMLDEVGANKAEVRTYELTGLGSRINEFARQLERAVNQQISGREQRVSITPYAPADALIVTARAEQFAQVEQMMEQLKPLMAVTQAKTEFFALEHVDAAQIVGTVQSLIRTRLLMVRGSARGSQDFSVMADPRTNRLIVFAPESIMPDVRATIQELDIEVKEDNVFTRELKYADPWETRNMINDVFGYRGSRRGQSRSEQVYVTVNNNMLVIKAPPKKLEQINALLDQIDREDLSGLQIQTYQLKVLNAQTVATQVQLFLRSIGGVSRRGQMQPGAFAEPTTNTLVVVAPARHLPFIEGLINQIEALGEGETASAEAYVLKNARADRVQRHVDQMLKAKVAEQEGFARGRTVQQKTVVMAEPETNRLFVFAPRQYQRLAAEIIALIDQEVDTGEIVHIVPLENSDAAQVAQTVTQALAGGGPRVRGAPTVRVKVVPDPGSNSIILSGLPRDVAEVERLVGELEAASDTIPELQYFTLEHAQAYEAAEALRAIFPPSRNAAETVTVTEDEYYNRLLVTANKRKMRQVEAVIAQLDVAPEEGEAFLSGGKELYFVELEKGDPWEIAFSVSEFFPLPEEGGPQIDGDWFGEYITVACRPSEFPRIERLIRQFEQRAKPEIVIRAIDFTGDRQRLFQYLRARELEFKEERPAQLPGTESIIIDLHPEDPEQESGSGAPRARAVSGGGAAPQVGGGVVWLALLSRQETQEAAHTPASAPATVLPPEPGRTSRRELPTVQVLPDGRLIIRGPRERVQELEDAISLFEEDLSRGEVIRIFRFRYGDVNAASRILDLMFNEPRVRIPQVRRPQPQQQQRGGRGSREGEEDQRQGLMQQIQQMIGGRAQEAGRTTTGGQRVRIATDASHNYLIVKCDEGLLPEITRLLRELDIPPAQVDVRVFQLKNLEAGETANNIKEVLGITKARTRQPTRPTRGRSPQQQLLEILQQQMVTIGGGVEGSAKIESVEIVPNTVTNSLLVSAPPDVMTIIENVIHKLEALEGGDITVIRHYELVEAKVDDVLPLLQEIFSAAGRARGPRGRGSPADLGPVTISGDPRSNTIIYVAQAKDVQTVEEQIQRLDIPGAVAEVEMYVCKYGDAVGIAQAVSEMFVTGGRRARGGRARAAPQPESMDIRITAEPATNTILVFAPQEKRALIMDQIRQLDHECFFDVREIDVVFARPEVVADALLQIFGGSGGSAMTRAAGRRGGARRQVAQTPGRIVVIPDRNAKKLLVRAPDEIFQKMKRLVEEVLDVQSENLLIRTFPLKHADAEVVVESVKGALLEFMQLERQLGGEGVDMDAFTAVADPRTNSVVVVGSQETFMFVEQLLAAVDVDTPAEQQKQFRIFVLDRADAQTVADAINSFAAGGEALTGGGRRGGRRPGMRAAAGLSTGAILDVQAMADLTTNSVMVYGRADDIDLVEEAVINRLEGALAESRDFATIEVKEALPTQLISYIQPFLDEMSGATESDRRRGGAGAVRQGPRLIGNDNAGTILVYGSRRQIEEVRTLVARFDTKDTLFNQFEIVPVPWGQDAVALAQMVQDLVNGSEQESAQRTGRQPRFITASADEQSNAIVVFGEPAQIAIAKTVVQQLSEIRPEKPVTRIIELVNLSSAEAEQLINDLQQRRSGGASIRGGTRSPTYRRTPTRSPSRRSSPTRRPRRRSWHWQRSVAGPRYALAPTGALTPAVGTACFQPGVAALVLTQAAQSASQPAEPPPAEPALSERERQQQKLLSSISGQLRGEVIATPLDSRRIIVTGDAEDVDFIVQMLALMERTTPEPVIRVFTLEHTKAPSLAPLLQEAMEALIEARVGGAPDRVDRFSIIAEARSNSLIVSASEPNMAMIAELIEKLDLETLRPTQTKLVPLRHIRAAEAYQLLADAIRRLNDMREVPAAAQASIQAVERSNAILVVGTPADISEIERIIAGIDVELPPENDFTTAHILVVDLKNARAPDLAETLNELIQMERAAGARGAESKLPLLRRLILKTATGQELPPIDLDKPIVIFPEEGKNSLIIYSSERNSTALLEIVKLFDALPVGEEVEVKSFALQHANAERVAELLRELFEDAKRALQRPSGLTEPFRAGQMPPVPPGVAGRGLPYNVVTGFDARSNRVFVVGHRDSVLLAAGLIAELDQPSADLALRPYVVQLKNIQATTLREKLDELLQERLEALGSDRNQARDSAIIQADDRSNALIVLASAEIYEMVADLARQLDSAEPYSVVDSEFRRLKYADAAKLAGLLQELFDKKKDAESDVAEGGQKNVLFVFADARSNSLMLTGTRDYLQEAGRLVDNLDQAFDPTVQFRLRPVRLNSAANIATLLEEMIQESRRQQEEQMQGTPIHVAADPYSNSLLLAASAEDMVMLERWIDVLDRPAEPGRITRIIPLLRGSAEELARNAQQLFESRAQGAAADVTVTYDPTTNSVIAIGPPAVVADIEDLIRQLNAAEGAGAVVRIFKLKEADAQVAGELLRSILEGRGGTVDATGSSSGGSRQEAANQVMLIFQREHPEMAPATFKALRSQIVVIDDLRTNSLIVLAPPEGMPLMESLVAALDVPPEAAEIRVFKLRNSDAEEMVEMLNELFATGETRTRGAEGEEERVLTLPGLGVGGRQMVSFTVDTRTNSVIAAGTKGYLDLADELILQLDSEPMELRKTFVYEPRNNTAAAIQQAISEFNEADRQVFDELQQEMSAAERMRREIVAVSNEDTNRVIFSYDPRRESELLDLVRDLDQPPPQVMIQVLVVEVTLDNSLELGVEFAFQDLQYTKAGPTDTTTFDFVGGTDIGAAGTGLGGFTFTITGADFNFLFRTLQNEGSLNVLSRPQIVAMDNQEANIKITNDVPYVAGSNVTATGIIQTNVQRREVGIELTVTPHINPDGFVRMEIKQTVSDITGSTVDVGQGLTSPIFLDREAETTVTVKDNETVVLGGLITTKDEQREQKVPILGDIPLLGMLFSNRRLETKRTELLVILTPRVVRTVEDYRELSAQERDRTGALPGEVLTSGLMNSLRVRPEELRTPEGGELLGPFPQQPVPSPPDEYDQEIYGPIRSSAGEQADEQHGINPDSYDVPISWAGFGGKWEAAAASRQP